MSDSNTTDLRQLKLVIARGPECPHCRRDGFDDWHREPTLRAVGLTLQGRLRCHGCGKYFCVAQHNGGETHSMAWAR